MSGPATESNGTPPSKKPRQGRSPAFPFIPLGKALERADAFRIAEGGRPTHYAPLTSAFAAWKMGSKTGPAQQTVAALGHFGLFEFEGSGANRSARLTEVALNILLDTRPKSSERDALIKQAALKPAYHADLRQKWPDGLPSAPTLETYLVRDRRFSHSGARDLIAEFKATIAFAKLDQPVNIPVNGGDDDPENDLKDVEVGDLVQAEVDGQLVFQEPKRVRAIQEDQGHQWVFVDGYESGVLMEQTELVEKGESGTSDVIRTITPPVLPLENTPLAEGWHEERLIDDGGVEIFVRFKGEPSTDRYEYLRDYYDFKISRVKSKTTGT